MYTGNCIVGSHNVLFWAQFWTFPDKKTSLYLLTWLSKRRIFSCHDYASNLTSFLAIWQCYPIYILVKNNRSTHIPTLTNRKHHLMVKHAIQYKYNKNRKHHICKNVHVAFSTVLVVNFLLFLNYTISLRGTMS